MGILNMNGTFYFTDDTAIAPVITQPVTLLKDTYLQRGTNLFTVLSAGTSDWTDNISVNLVTDGTLPQITPVGIIIPTGVKFVMLLTTGPIFCWNQTITRDSVTNKITNVQSTGFQIDDFYVVSGNIMQLNVVHKNANTNNDPISVQLISVY